MRPWTVVRVAARSVLVCAPGLACQDRAGAPGRQNVLLPDGRLPADGDVRYRVPACEWYNAGVAAWSASLGVTLVNFTSGTRSNADYTGEADRNFVSSHRIHESILTREREDPHGLNGYLLLLHVGAGPGRADTMHERLGGLLDDLSARGYRFVRVDDLLR